MHACCSRCCELVDTTDQGYSFVADFPYQLIRKSLIFATFSAAGMGIGLYMGRLIRENIQ